MDDRNVSYIVFEGTIARLERTIKRLIIVIVLLIVLFFATNALWIYEWNQYEYSDVTVDSQDGGNANYIGASGVINNAKDSGEEESKKEQNKSKGDKD